MVFFRPNTSRLDRRKGTTNMVVMKKGKNKDDDSSSESASKDKFLPCLTCKEKNHLIKNCFYKGKPKIKCNHYK